MDTAVTSIIDIVSRRRGEEACLHRLRALQSLLLGCGFAAARTGCAHPAPALPPPPAAAQVKATGEAVKQGVSAAQTGAEYAKTAYDQVGGCV